LSAQRLILKIKIHRAYFVFRKPDCAASGVFLENTFCSHCFKQLVLMMCCTTPIIECKTKFSNSAETETMFRKRGHYHRRTFLFLRGISLKAFVNLDTRCALKLSSNSLEERVSGEMSKIKSPYFMENDLSVPFLCSCALLCIFSWIHPVDALSSFFYDIRFNIILPFLLHILYKKLLISHMFNVNNVRKTMCICTVKHNCYNDGVY
jgi:hypothetical protein